MRQRVLRIALVAGWMGFCGSEGWTQSDAELAMVSARAALEAEDWARARDLLLLAAQTDPDNPDVFRHLGEAQLRLGAVDAALAAWRRTLDLAPQQEEARRMVAALETGGREAAARVRLVGGWLAEGLLERAREGLVGLRREALGSALRGEVLLLAARVEIESEEPLAALATLQELRVVSPDLAEAPEARLLRARALLARGGEEAAAALAELQRLAGDASEPMLAAEAELLWIRWRLAQQQGDTRELAAWIERHPGHPEQRSAELLLVDALLDETRRTQVPAESSGLAAGDERALAITASLLAETGARAAVHERVDRWLSHLEQHYFQRAAIGAALQGLERLAGMALPRTDRARLQQTKLAWQAARALQELRPLAVAGALLGPALPVSLEAVQHTFEELQQADPHGAQHAVMVAFARDVAALAGLLPQPPEPASVAATLSWSAHLSMQLVDRNGPSANDAADLALEIASTLHASESLTLVAQARTLQRSVVEALAPQHPRWPHALQRLVTWLGEEAAAPLAHGTPVAGGAGTGELLGEASALLGRLVRHHPALLEEALERLDEVLAPWSRAADAAVVETAYRELSESSPEAQRSAVELALARWYLPQIVAAHERLRAAGRKLPAELDAWSLSLLHTCYRLQGGRQDADPFVAMVRELPALLVSHFVKWERFDLAGDAIRAKTSPAVAIADAHAELRWASFLRERALHAALPETPEQGPAAVLPASLQAALAAYEAFLRDRPGHEGRAQAVEDWLGFGRWLETESLPWFAAKVYAALEVLARSQPDLAESRPERPAATARAAFGRARALEQAFRLEASDGDTGMPRAGPDLTAVLAAYRHLWDSDPDSGLGPPSLQRVTYLGLSQAGRGDFAGAEQVFAALQEPALGLHDADLFQLASAIGRLGTVLPARAAEMLTMLPFPAPLDASLLALFGERLAASAGANATTAPLPAAELARQQEAVDAFLQTILAVQKDHPARAALAEALVLGLHDHWRGLQEWRRAAELLQRYLGAHSSGSGREDLCLLIADDHLRHARQLPGETDDRALGSTRIQERFDAARAEIRKLAEAFADRESVLAELAYREAGSFLAEARVLAGWQPERAVRPYVRAARELIAFAPRYPLHAESAAVPTTLWGLGSELERLGSTEETVAVWNLLALAYPHHPFAEQAVQRIAQTYEEDLRQPLRAIEAYLEMYFSRGENPDLAARILNIAAQLQGRKRWIEALHALEVFVDSFPDHADAGDALLRIGQVHQANQAWEEAMAAYDRVLEGERPVPQRRAAQWAIAECKLNLSQWRAAVQAYLEFADGDPDDARAAEALRRTRVLKSLARHQDLVDEEGQRRSFDAQFQIGRIIQEELADPVKAIVEYAKVAARWPASHLADDALFQAGKLHLERGDVERAREALLAVAEGYPSSPLADDALYLVGASFEDEARVLAGVTRGESLADANDVAQKAAYQMAQENRRAQRERGKGLIDELKKAGRKDEVENQVAIFACQNQSFDAANTLVFSNWAEQQVEILSAAQLADRQDRRKAALRRAVAHFRRAAQVTSGDRASDALQRMARIYDGDLRDADAAMETWLEIVQQYGGTTVAEEASWKIARAYERASEHEKAIDAYVTFLRNYRQSPRASAAQAAIGENYEQLGRWVEAMDAYSKYLSSFPDGPLAEVVRDQIYWIKTYRL